MPPVELDSTQRRIFIDTAQLYEAFITTARKNVSYRGGMHWKKSKGREYLFKTRDRHGNGKSLGPRSAETEKIIKNFQTNKKELKGHLASLREKLKKQARFCKAADIQRVPRIVTSILRLLDQEKILGKNVVIVGTNALYAYEAAAGVFLKEGLMATKDMDILWDIRPKLTMVLQKEANQAGLIGILRKADRSFEAVLPGGFRAVNRDGFMVDLIKAEPRPVLKLEPNRMGTADDLTAAELPNLQWLVASPKFSQVVIGHDGYPAKMVSPDPRSFTLHKLWLSERFDREPIKKRRDREQALAVLRLVLQYLPQYQFDPADLRMFPKEVVADVLDTLSKSDLPPGFDAEI